MLSITQATQLLAEIYDVPESGLMTTKDALRRSGMFPTAQGRSIPPTTPVRIALLIIGLGVTYPERIAELADLRRFVYRPGDMTAQVTLGDVLSEIVKGLFENPGKAVDMHLIMTATEAPWATLQGPSGVVMQFGEVGNGGGFVTRQATVSLAPLALFCEAARNLSHPYSVTG
ncbi:hypothetical protein [uncultured Tateyamaria sp.]|uniref:hypothetical protein n=1 Tax=Tateyamaria sp. 1078 TaxID=3417464 RepID=UPI002603857E|nr:hypothetical protein [uncultured Tateyamaria sp.]